MTLIKDLIQIPEQINKGDFVIKLAEDVENPDLIVKDYVVTEQLAACFDNALSFIKSAVETRTSKASYLHGSFGSGKSHFMAVLHLILQGVSQARGIPELASVVNKHNPWVGGKKFLLTPYHMIGAKNLESAVLGGYADHIRRKHSDARGPGVFLAEKIFGDARTLRERMGDNAFFDALNQSSGDDDGWGELGGGWNLERFERAIDAPPGDEDRLELVGDLVSVFFTSQRDASKSSGEGFVNIDDGLSVISKHASKLGYDAVILFLDELILWLASHSADLNFVQLEGQKLAKLVESQTPDRPVPIVSFVARQRDLRDLVGKEVSGAAALNFGDILGHWEGRFHTITLEDRNLPKIVEKRLLKPKSNGAMEMIDAAFEQTAKAREEVMKTLLTSEGDRAMFRQVYPFSPALAQTLVAVSSVLQRERTALKAMVQLLVDHRETLKLGDVVPVGDLFDIIAHGEEVFSEEMRIHFENAKRLYHQKLLPLLEKQHGARREELEKLPFDDSKRMAFVNDDRLVKTLLLSALTPGVESLRAMTATKLAALNHGTIRSPIPGREGQMVARRIKTWAAEVGEIKVGDEANPSISLQLTGVDTESIIDQARREDNEGNRIRTIREMLFDQLGIEDKDAFHLEHKFSWRNTPRLCEVVYTNVRTQPDSTLTPATGAWKLVLDFPFDEPPHGPRDDIGRLQTFLEENPAGCKTVAWVPSFFKDQAKKDLGLLVILEHILTGERYRQYSGHLSAQDQPAARALLENQRSMLRQRVLNHLNAAFGLEIPDDGAIDPSHALTDHFQSLFPGFSPRPPAAPNLKGAMEDLLDQAYSHQFPAHPHFEAEAKPAGLRKVLEVAREAAQTEDKRIPVDKSIRLIVRQIANPLLLGEMAETHFVLGRHWPNHFNRKISGAGGIATVGKLREWIDQPKPMGLPDDVANLVIVVYAEQTNQAFYLQGIAMDPSITSLRDDMELRPQVLPDQKTWETAVARAGALFGIASSNLLNASNVSKLAEAIRKIGSEKSRDCKDLREKLKERLDAFGLDRAKAPRMQTADAAIMLLNSISSAESDNELVVAVVEAEIATSETAMAQSISTAAVLIRKMRSAAWDVFQKTGREIDVEIDEARNEVKEALENDEHVTGLEAAIKGAQAKAISALTRRVERPGPKPGPGSGPDPVPEKVKPPSKGARIVEKGEKTGLGIAELKSLAAELEQKINKGRVLRVNLTWIIEEENEA